MPTYTGFHLPLRVERAPHLVLVRTDHKGVRIDPTWKAMSLSASATDHLSHEMCEPPLSSVVPFTRCRTVSLFSDPAYSVKMIVIARIWGRSRNLWIGCMAVGVSPTRINRTACSSIQGRVAIMGVKMTERPTVHVNLGQAVALIARPRATIYDACANDRCPHRGHQLPRRAITWSSSAPA